MFKSISSTAFVPAKASSATIPSVSCPSLFKLNMAINPNFENNANVNANLKDQNNIVQRSVSSSSLQSTVASSEVSSTFIPAFYDNLIEESNDYVLDETILSPTRKSLASTLEVDVDNVLHFFSPQFQPSKPVICGHRGAIYKSLENTRHSIYTAHQVGCEEVEIDVFLLKCGTLCVFHGSGTDENPGHFQHYSNNMDGSILDYTYDEVRKNFKFNPRYEEFSCGADMIHSLEENNECYIPTLEEVLSDAKKHGITLKIELKGHGTEVPTLNLVESMNMVDQVHFSSFELSRIQKIRELRPQRDLTTGQYVYKTGALFDDVPDNFIELALDAGSSEVHLKYSLCTTSRVNAIHAAGMDSMCWFRGPIGMKEDVSSVFYDVGNENEIMFRIVMATGVRKMCVNKPDVLFQMLNQ